MSLQLNCAIRVGNNGVLAIVGSRNSPNRENEAEVFFLAQVRIARLGMMKYLENRVKKYLGGECVVVGTEPDVSIFFSRKTRGVVRNLKSFLRASRTLFLRACEEAEIDVIVEEESLLDQAIKEHNEEMRRVNEEMDRLRREIEN